jgi:hypothetical protein
LLLTAGADHAEHVFVNLVRMIQILKIAVGNVLRDSDARPRRGPSFRPDRG